MTALRPQLVDLVGQAPSGLHVLGVVALALYDRWELLDCVRVMREAADWADPEAWRDRALDWAAQLEAQLLASMRDAPAA